MPVQFSNDAYGISVSEIGVDDTTITIGEKHWDLFPDLSGEYYCYLSIIPRGERDVAEIVKATAFIDGVFTVERGVDGTSPMKHRRGARVAVRLVSAALYALKEDAAAEAKRQVEEILVQGGDANARVSSIFGAVGAKLIEYQEELSSDLPTRKGSDELTDDNLNEQAVYLNNRLTAVLSMLSAAVETAANA